MASISRLSTNFVGKSINNGTECLHALVPHTYTEISVHVRCSLLPTHYFISQFGANAVALVGVDQSLVLHIRIVALRVLLLPRPQIRT